MTVCPILLFYPSVGPLVNWYMDIVVVTNTLIVIVTVISSSTLIVIVNFLVCLSVCPLGSQCQSSISLMVGINVVIVDVHRMNGRK